MYEYPKVQVHYLLQIVKLYSNNLIGSIKLILINIDLVVTPENNHKLMLKGK